MEEGYVKPTIVSNYENGYGTMYQPLPQPLPPVSDEMREHETFKNAMYATNGMELSYRQEPNYYTPSQQVGGVYMQPQQATAPIVMMQPVELAKVAPVQQTLTPDVAAVEQFRSVLLSNRFPQILIDRVCTIADGMADLLAATDEDIEEMLKCDEIKKLTLLRFVKWVHSQRSSPSKSDIVPSEQNETKSLPHPRQDQDKGEEKQKMTAAKRQQDTKKEGAKKKSSTSSNKAEAPAPLRIEIVASQSDGDDDEEDTSELDDLHEYMMQEKLERISVHDLDQFRYAYRHKGSYTSRNHIVKKVSADNRFRVEPLDEKKSGYYFYCRALENTQKQAKKRTHNSTNASPAVVTQRVCQDLYTFMKNNSLSLVHARRLQNFKRAFPQHAGAIGIMHKLHQDSRFIVEDYKNSPDGPNDYIIRRKAHTHDDASVQSEASNHRRQKRPKTQS